MACFFIRGLLLPLWRVCPRALPRGLPLPRGVRFARRLPGVHLLPRQLLLRGGLQLAVPRGLLLPGPPGRRGRVPNFGANLKKKRLVGGWGAGFIVACFFSTYNRVGEQDYSGLFFFFFITLLYFRTIYIPIYSR